MVTRRLRARDDDRRPAAARPRRPDGRRGGGRAGNAPHLGPVRLTPTRVLFAVAILGSLGFVAYTFLAVRDPSSIPMLAAGATVLGLVFGGLAVSGGISTWRAGAAGQGGRAFVHAVGGGVAAMVAAGCFALAVVLALVWSA